MQLKGKKILDIIVKQFFFIAAIIIGIIFGVVFSNWSYFTIKKEITVENIVSVVITSILAVYVSSNIQSAIQGRQNNHTLFSNEVMKIISSLEKIIEWLNNGIIPFEEGKICFKKCTLLISDLNSIFSNSTLVNSSTLSEILKKHNNLKRSIFEVSPENNKINLTPSLQVEYEEKIRIIKNDLLKLCLN